MFFQKEIEGEVVIEIVLTDRATVTESEIFRRILMKDIDEGWRKIVIDLEECSFMDSTFLGTIIIGLKTINKLNGELKLANVHGDALAMLDLSNTRKIFQIYGSREKAINSFNLSN